MIHFSVDTEPYSSKNECGDFYLYIELEDYYLLVIGDIGGHGSPEVYQIANKIKEFIINNKKDNIQDIIQKVHKNKEIKNRGITMFIAQVYKNIPLVNYCAVGNTKSILFRNNHIKTLKSQDGIIGYDIPSKINVNMIKILKNDILIVTTDGVTLHNMKEITSTIQKIKELNTLTKYIATHYKNDDDSLCVALRFNKSKKNDFSIEYKKDNIKEEPKKLKKIIKTNKNIIVKPKKEKKKKLLKFNNNKLLAENIKKESINLAIDKILSHSQFDKKIEIKIKTFLHEIIIFSSIDMYIQNNILQLYIKNINQFKHTLEFLFEEYYIFNQDECIINITLEKHIKLSIKEFIDLQKIIELNLSDKDFKLYKEREMFLSNMAYKDNLTQIYNRNKLNNLMESELKRDSRYNRIFSIAIIDIDLFKKFNDTYGHLIGDEVLILLANCLKENSRATDVYARWGGEEFVLLFPETDSKGGYVASEQMRKAIEKLSHKTAGGITASFGVTQYIDGDTLDSMFKRCDDALYEAKELGRNRVCVK